MIWKRCHSPIHFTTQFYSIETNQSQTATSKVIADQRKK